MNQHPPAPLAVQVRGEAVESMHLGYLVLVDPDGGILASRGSVEARVYARSSLKPVQALPLFLGGAAAAFDLPEPALAVALASHSGEDVHREAVMALLDRAGLEPSLLQCGTHAPYHEPTARALVLAGEAPSVLHCNCSGKHAGMLAVCKHHGWDLAGYRWADHPLQRWIRDLVAELAGVPAAEIGHAVDGCGVPVWNLPITGLARAFARLGTPTDLAPELRAAAERVTGLMARHPRLIAGEGRLDTDLLAAGRGTLVGKIGGEGVHAGAVRGAGIGWAIKVSDGNRRALGPALARALGAVGHPLPADPALAAHVAPVVRNNHGEVVGQLKATW